MYTGHIGIRPINKIDALSVSLFYMRARSPRHCLLVSLWLKEMCICCVVEGYWSLWCPVASWRKKKWEFLKKFIFLGFEVLSPVVMKGSVIWGVTPCRMLNDNRLSVCHLLSRRFSAWLILRPWRWRQHIPPKLCLTFNGLHGVISQKIKLFKFALVGNLWREHFL
jgi:hypothetical protein